MFMLNICEQTKIKNAERNAKAVAEFQHLRKVQRYLANNLGTLVMDLKKHITVKDTLKGVDADRKCFRLIGEILVENTVKELLPQLAENKDFMEKLITRVTEDLTKKGQQINKFKEEHDIKFCSEQMPNETQKPKDDKMNLDKLNVLISNRWHAVNLTHHLLPSKRAYLLG